MTWLIGIFWTLSQAARFGESNSRTGVGAYFRSQGVGPIRQIFGIWSAIMLFLLPVVVIAVVTCLVFAMPGDSKEATMWVWTNLQFAALFLITIGPLALLGVGVASRFGSLIGCGMLYLLARRLRQDIAVYQELIQATSTYGGLATSTFDG